jgi:hypothetical protein
VVLCFTLLSGTWDYLPNRDAGRWCIGGTQKPPDPRCRDAKTPAEILPFGICNLCKMDPLNVYSWAIDNPNVYCPTLGLTWPYPAQAILNQNTVLFGIIRHSGPHPTSTNVPWLCSIQLIPDCFSLSNVMTCVKAYATYSCILWTPRSTI